MALKTLSIALAFFAAIAVPANAQDQNQNTTDPNDKSILIPLDDRGGLPVPKNLTDLKNLSLAFWVKFRGTSQHVYRYVNEAAQFHAYTHVCKRHELNVTLAPITELSNYYIQAAIPAHYDEPEFTLLEPLPKKEQQRFLEDMSSDLYAFEYGFRTSTFSQAIAESGKTRKTFCANIENDYKHSYIALRAIAQRRLAEFRDRTAFD